MSLAQEMAWRLTIPSRRLHLRAPRVHILRVSKGPLFMIDTSKYNVNASKTIMKTYFSVKIARKVELVQPSVALQREASSRT